MIKADPSVLPKRALEVIGHNEFRTGLKTSTLLLQRGGRSSTSVAATAIVSSPMFTKPMRNSFLEDFSLSLLKKMLSHYFRDQILTSRSRLLNLGYPTLASRSWFPDPGFQILPTRSWLPDPDFQILVSRSWLPDPAYQMLAIRSWPQDLAYQILSTTFWLADPGYQMLAIRS